MSEHEKAIKEIEEAINGFTATLSEIRKVASTDAERCFSIAITKAEELCMWMRRGIEKDFKW